jgi:hypothetical protein
VAADRRPAVGRVAGALLVAATSVLAIPSARAAATPAVVETGWWTRSPAQSAPADGVAVGVAPDGPTSVAAVRLDLGDTGVTSASLAATEAGGTLQSLAGLRVCFAATPWTAVRGGPLADAPAADCSNQAVRMTRADSGAWSADITPFTSGRTGVVSVMIVPEPDAGAVPGVPSAYDVQLAAPTLTATPVPAAAPTSEPPPIPAPVEPVPAPSFFTPLAAPEEGPPSTEPPTLVAGAPPVALGTPTAAPRLAPSADGPSPWRLGLWLRVVFTAALIGAAAGLARWSIVSGPINRLVPDRRIPS